MKKEDGAYYAVKGFVYQFDYTILEIFNQSDYNKPVKIEQEQDLSYENCIVQVKHYQTKYKTSKQKQKVKDATIKLINDFSANQDSEYCLYIYLNGKSEGAFEFPTITDLNELLGKRAANNYVDSLKEKFIKKFTIVYASDFKEQFLSIIKKIKQTFKCKDEAYIYHSLIRNHLFNLLANNATKDSGKRKCCKQEILNLINDAKSKIVYAAYEEVLGKTKYLKLIKSEFPKIDYTYNNYLFVGDNITETNSNSISDLIKEIVDNHFLKRNLDARPFNIILEKDHDELIKIKRRLIRLGVKFNDGYESYNQFSESSYNEKPMVEVQTRPRMKKCSFSVRLISHKTFLQMKDPIFADRIYAFGNSFKPKKLFDEDVPYFAIDEIDVNQMSVLLNKKR